MSDSDVTLCCLPLPGCMNFDIHGDFPRTPRSRDRGVSISRIGLLWWKSPGRDEAVWMAGRVCERGEVDLVSDLSCWGVLADVRVLS